MTTEQSNIQKRNPDTKPEYFPAADKKLYRELSDKRRVLRRGEKNAIEAKTEANAEATSTMRALADAVDAAEGTLAAASTNSGVASAKEIVDLLDVALAGILDSRMDREAAEAEAAAKVKHEAKEEEGATVEAERRVAVEAAADALADALAIEDSTFEAMQADNNDANQRAHFNAENLRAAREGELKEAESKLAALTAATPVKLEQVKLEPADVDVAIDYLRGVLQDPDDARMCTSAAVTCAQFIALTPIADHYARMMHEARTDDEGMDIVRMYIGDMARDLLRIGVHEMDDRTGDVVIGSDVTRAPGWREGDAQAMRDMLGDWLTFAHVLRELEDPHTASDRRLRVLIAQFNGASL